MTGTTGPHELALQFRALNAYLHAGGDPATVRQRLVDLVTVAVPGCDWAAIYVWPERSRPRSVVYNDDVARAADELQYEFGDGPCLSATREHAPVHSPDLATEARWPDFTAATRDRSPVRGVLSFDLAARPDPVSLNLYSGRAGALDRDAVTTGALFATHAAALNAHIDSAHKAATLGAALSTSRQIGAAIGILMAAYKISQDEAVDLLQNASSRLHRKLRDIADDVTDTGELPRRTDGTGGTGGTDG